MLTTTTPVQDDNVDTTADDEDGGENARIEDDANWMIVISWSQWKKKESVRRSQRCSMRACRRHLMGIGENDWRGKLQHLPRTGKRVQQQEKGSCSKEGGAQKAQEKRIVNWEEEKEAVSLAGGRFRHFDARPNGGGAVLNDCQYCKEFDWRWWSSCFIHVFVGKDVSLVSHIFQETFHPSQIETLCLLALIKKICFCIVKVNFWTSLFRRISVTNRKLCKWFSHKCEG